MRVILPFFFTASLALAQTAPLELSLKSAVEVALSPEGNTRVQLSAESVKQAESRSAQARGALLPDVSGSVSYQSQTRNLEAVGIVIDLPIPGFQSPTFIGPFNVFDARASVQQTVFDSSAIRRYQAARTNIAVARTDSETTAEQVAAQVARAYLAALKAQVDVEVLKANVTLADAVLQQVTHQKAAGTGTGIEITRARVQLSNEQQRLLVAQNDQRRALPPVAPRRGAPPRYPRHPDGHPRHTPVDPVTIEEAKSRAFDTRPDLKTQVEREDSARLTSSAVEMERLPSLAAFADYGATGTGIGHALPTRTYGVALRVPVFDGGRKEARRAESASQYRADTGVGWVYQYAVISKEFNLSDTRTIQDWNLKFALAKAEGVAEVASVGGFVKQYNVILDPQRMRNLGITMQKMRDAIRASNADVGGRTVELSEFEYVIRGKGYLKSINDLGDIVLKANNGTPVLLRDVARVELGPDERRGITELNGEGEVASGIVLQRFGVNALDVIENVKKRFKEIASSLPNSVEIRTGLRPFELIKAAIETLKRTLFEESLIVALVCIVFLLHFRSALVAIVMLPVGILIAFGTMKPLGLGANIMSLGGIAIAIGAMIDAAIVMIENAHKHLERAEPGRSRIEILIEAASEVGPALFFSLLIITVSFMPIFTLELQEGRLFSPLAFTKTFSMAAAALLSVTLVPALMVVCIRGRIVPEHKNPINRFLIWIYRPVIAAVMRAKVLVILLLHWRFSPSPSGQRGNWAPNSCQA